MSQVIITMAFSIYLIAYGSIALFKKDWIQKFRSRFGQSAGDGKTKNDDTLKGNWLAVVSLVLGIISLLMNIAMIIAINRAVEL